MKVLSLVSALLCLTNTTFAAVEGWLSAAYQTPAHVRATTNSVIARFWISAGTEDIRLTQIAFDIAASGAWISEQVTNVRLHTGIVTDTQIAGPEQVWSTPIVCDCDSGRVIFDSVSNLVIESYTTLRISLIADVGVATGSFIVSYSHGDSRIIGVEPPYVNAALRPVQNVDSEKFTGVYLEFPIVPANYARIDNFWFGHPVVTVEDSWVTNSRALYLQGTIEPHTSYKVEASTNLIDWNEVGTVSDPGNSEILKEHVGTLSNTYTNLAFFRLRKIVP